MSIDNQQGETKSKYRINYRYISNNDTDSHGSIEPIKGEGYREFESSDKDVIGDAGKIIGHLRQSGYFGFSLERIVQKEITEKIDLPSLSY